MPPPCTGENVWRSQLVATAPASRAWTEAVVQITGCEFVPVATYAIRATPDPEAPASAFSDDLVIATIAKPGTRHWADCVSIFDGAQWSPPNQIVAMDDIMAAVFYFTNHPNKPPRTWVGVADERPDTALNFVNIHMIVQGFQREPYPYSAPGVCP